MAAKNEWPLLATSVSHALTTYADHLYLFDHASTDGSKVGISELIKLFPGRITFFESAHDPFDQEAIFNILFFRAIKQGFDWVHFMDADEFLIVDQVQELSSILDTIGHEWSALALRVENYMINSEAELAFEEELLAANYRVRTDINLGEPIETFMESVQAGRRIPQEARTAPKLLVRADPELFISHGGHQLKYGNGIDWVEYDSHIASADTLNIFVAHLPYTSMNRLRVRNTRKFLHKVDVRFRIVETLSEEEELIEFWRSTRLNPNKIEKAIAANQIFQDDRLIAVLKKSLDFLGANETLARSREINLQNSEIISEQISLTEVIENVRRYIRGVDKFWARSVE